MSTDIHRHCSLASSGDEKVHPDLPCSSQMQASDLVGQGLGNEPVNEFGGNSDGDGTSCTDSISSEEEGDLDEDFETALKDIFSEGANSPTLLSAMKGSREKSGASPRKLTVKWAPDVYDPPPTIFSQMLVRGEKQQKSRKDRKNVNVKEKQKGGSKSSRGITGKEKKQHHKIAGSSKKRYKSLDVYNDFGYDVDGPEW